MDFRWNFLRLFNSRSFIDVLRRSVTSSLIRRSLSTVTRHLRFASALSAAGLPAFIWHKSIEARSNRTGHCRCCRESACTTRSRHNGVSSDHPEVKNIIHTFTKIAEHKNVRFLGDIHVDHAVRLKELQDFYLIIVLAYGSSIERALNIPVENVFSAKDFVGWYIGKIESLLLRLLHDDDYHQVYRKTLNFDHDWMRRVERWSLVWAMWHWTVFVSFSRRSMNSPKQISRISLWNRFVTVEFHMSSFLADVDLYKCHLPSRNHENWLNCKAYEPGSNWMTTIWLNQASWRNWNDRENDWQNYCWRL